VTLEHRPESVRRGIWLMTPARRPMNIMMRNYPDIAGYDARAGRRASRAGRRSRRHGVVVVWAVVVLLALFAFVSLAVDVGRAQTAKTELRRAADAAARYAVVGLANDTHVARAISAAGDNSADGSPIAITAADVVKGNYDPSTKAFTPNGSPANAVSVTCARTGDRGVPLVFAQVLGRPRIDVTATAIAYGTPRLPAFTGLASVTFKNNTFVGSYDSTVTLNPTQALANNGAGVGSNGQVDGGNNTLIKGNVTLGPKGDDSGVTVVGSTTTTAAPLTAPADPSWNPSANPMGLPQDYTASGGVSLPGGTYWFTNLTIDGDLSFTGPALVYVNGDVQLDGTLIASGQLPVNLKIYQLGNGRKFGDSKSNNVTIVAVVNAPGSDFSFKNKLKYVGAGVFNSISAKNGADFFYDQKINGVGGGGGTNITLVR
jgi:Flp pilus assembly protein TadG